MPPLQTRVAASGPNGFNQGLYDLHLARNNPAGYVQLWMDENIGTLPSLLYASGDEAPTTAEYSIFQQNNGARQDRPAGGSLYYPPLGSGQQTDFTQHDAAVDARLKQELAEAEQRDAERRAAKRALEEQGFSPTAAGRILDMRDNPGAIHGKIG